MGFKIVSRYQASNFIRQNNEKNTNILLNHEYYTFGGLPTYQMCLF